MSHFLDFETQITDQTALVRALCRVELPRHAHVKHWVQDMVESLDKAQNLYGYQNDRRDQVAHVIIRRCHVGGMSNDLGFVKTDKGNFKALISEYDQSQGYNPAWLTRLYTYYNVEKSKIELETRGIEYTETRDDTGRIQLRAKFKVADTGSKIRVRVGG